MHDFVDLETLYESNESRTVNNLANLYEEKTRIQSAIHRMVSNHFAETDICNKSVLLKPNWVRHELKESDYLCLRTNDTLLLCVLEEILKLSPSKVLIADAPVQSCDWDKMIKPTFINAVERLQDHYHISINIKDFRRTITDTSNNKIEKDLHPMSDYVVFDLGDLSYLEPITTDKNRFRVTCYNPDRMAEVHHKGMHKYCIAKDVFDYDVIITIPKLKTHRMAGITNALKLLIGINGDKDYLPHHRTGSKVGGGDNYLNRSVLRSVSSYLSDAGNRRIGTKMSKMLLSASSFIWKLSRPDKATIENAGWYGNDTIWRTVMDVNTIALYGDKNGMIHENQQRRLYTIMDGVIGGQCDGPLHPEPSPLGVIAISDNPYLMDVVAGKLYHLNSSKIPLIREANKLIETNDYTILVNSNTVTIDEVLDFGIDIKMSPGWEDYNTFK